MRRVSINYRAQVQMCGGLSKLTETHLINEDFPWVATKHMTQSSSDALIHYSLHDFFMLYFTHLLVFSVLLLSLWYLVTLCLSGNWQILLVLPLIYFYNVRYAISATPN